MRPWRLIPLIALLPIVAAMVLYAVLAWQRHLVQPDDPLLPLPSQLWSRCVSAYSWSQADSLAPLWMDTQASLWRLFVSLTVAGAVALVVAIMMHEFRFLRQMFTPSLLVIAKIPSVAILPILLLWLGVNEKARIALVILGITPYLCIQLYHDLQRITHPLIEQMNGILLPRWQRVLFIDTPLIWPAFLQQIQLLLGQAWLFLLLAETFGARNGLGYRIFVVRRFLAMDIILVYVFWIALLSVTMYYLIELWQRRFRWYVN